MLIHDAQPMELYAKLPESIHSFVAKYHTTTEQLAALAARDRPKLLVVYHTISWPPGMATPKHVPDAEFHTTPDVVERELKSRYSGRFVVGRDLDVY